MPVTNATRVRPMRGRPGNANGVATATATPAAPLGVPPPHAGAGGAEEFPLRAPRGGHHPKGGEEEPPRAKQEDRRVGGGAFPGPPPPLEPGPPPRRPLNISSIRSVTTKPPTTLMV